MNESEIMELLHQRKPYLMISEVIDLTPQKIKAVKRFTQDDFFLTGHFPGAPVIPGSMLQEVCTQSAGLLLTKYYAPIDNYSSIERKGWAIGILNKVEAAKFYEIAKPNLDVYCEVELVDMFEYLYKFNAKVFQGDKLKAKLKFNLVTAKDNILYEG